MTKKGVTRVQKPIGKIKTIHEVMSYSDFNRLGLKPGDIAYDIEVDRKLLIIQPTVFENTRIGRDCETAGIVYKKDGHKLTRDILLVGYALFYNDGSLERYPKIIPADLKIPVNPMSICDEPFLGGEALREYQELEARIESAGRERARYQELCKILDDALIKFNHKPKG